MKLSSNHSHQLVKLMQQVWLANILSGSSGWRKISAEAKGGGLGVHSGLPDPPATIQKASQSSVPFSKIHEKIDR